MENINKRDKLIMIHDFSYLKNTITEDRLFFEKVLRASSFQNIVGVDEAGRGPCAGPLFAASYLYDEEYLLEEVRDSKQLSEKVRESLFDRLQTKAKAYCIVNMSAASINTLGIGKMNTLAIHLAVLCLHTKPDFVLSDFMKLNSLEDSIDLVKRLDASEFQVLRTERITEKKRVDLEEKKEQRGFQVLKLGKEDVLNCLEKSSPDLPYLNLVKGDQRSMTISCASILAKVARDRYMRNVNLTYPHYNFDKNKGYGTKAHKEAVLQYGLCPEHRRLFCESWLKDKGKKS